MAKDAKGHGSEKRGANSIDSVYSSKAGVGGLGKGMYARTASGAQYKLNAAATGGRIPSVGSDLDPSQHTAVTDQAAADTLAGGHPKSGAVPVHDAMSKQYFPKMSDSDRQAARDRESASSRDEYNRDLTLRSRNGQVGSGMKYRG